MLDTRAFYTRIIESTGLPYIEDELPDMIRFSTLNATEVFQIAVTTTSADDSYKIAVAVSQIAPQMIQGFQETANMKIVDPPVLNREPVSPNLPMNTAIGFLAGAALAMLFVYIRDILDTKIKKPEELSDKYDVYVLAEITDFPKSERVNKPRPKGKFVSPVIDKAKKTLIIEKGYQEAYKIARTNLGFAVLKKTCKKIAVISSLSREGKTTTSVNLAIAFAQQLNVRVLLMDCDLRKPRVNRFMDTPNVPGVTDCLSGAAGLNIVVKETLLPNMQTINAGTIPPNPSELLASKNFESLVAQVEQYYDYIIFDTSPLNIVIDALSVIKLCDRVVFSVVMGESTHPDFSKTLNIVKNVDVRVAGVIVHGVEDTRKKGYANEYYYYDVF
jgi:capsular exopolysaccharide synthesis family protein